MPARSRFSASTSRPSFLALVMARWRELGSARSFCAKHTAHETSARNGITNRPAVIHIPQSWSSDSHGIAHELYGGQLSKDITERGRKKSSALFRSRVGR